MSLTEDVSLYLSGAWFNSKMRTEVKKGFMSLEIIMPLDVNIIFYNEMSEYYLFTPVGLIAFRQ